MWFDDDGHDHGNLYSWISNYIKYYLKVNKYFVGSLKLNFCIVLSMKHTQSNVQWIKMISQYYDKYKQVVILYLFSWLLFISCSLQYLIVHLYISFSVFSPSHYASHQSWSLSIHFLWFAIIVIIHVYFLSCIFTFPLMIIHLITMRNYQNDEYLNTNDELIYANVTI